MLNILLDAWATAGLLAKRPRRLGDLPADPADASTVPSLAGYPVDDLRFLTATRKE